MKTIYVLKLRITYKHRTQVASWDGRLCILCCLPFREMKASGRHQNDAPPVRSINRLFETACEQP